MTFQLPATYDSDVEANACAVVSIDYIDRFGGEDDEKDVRARLFGWTPTWLVVSDPPHGPDVPMLVSWQDVDAIQVVEPPT